MATAVDTPKNVVAALAAVMRDLPGIGKGEKSQQGYSYRGIEQITAQAQPLLAKYGVVFVPRVIDTETREVTVNGKPWTDERLRVEYTVYGPGGVDDCIRIGPILGIGRDNSDKGANKAMSQAYKYALLQTLCIGDAKDDGDQQSHESDRRGQPGDQQRQPRERRTVAPPVSARRDEPEFTEDDQTLASLPDMKVLRKELDALDVESLTELSPLWQQAGIPSIKTRKQIEKEQYAKALELVLDFKVKQAERLAALEPREGESAWDAEDRVAREAGAA